MSLKKVEAIIQAGTTKYAFNRDWGLLLNTGWNHLSDKENASIEGWNPTLLSLKGHYGISPNQAVGFELGVGAPADGDSLNRGKPDLVFTEIYSVDIGQTRLDANFGLTRIGNTEPGIDRHQYQWALALSKPVSDDWSIAGEFSGVAGNGLAPTTQALVCLAYTVSRTVVIDFGLAGAMGGNSAATKNIFTGVSVLFD